MSKWYEAKMTNDHQGLVIDEETGENVAVSYKKENARLIASGPDMLEALKKIAEYQPPKNIALSNALKASRYSQKEMKFIAQRAIYKAEKGA